MRDVVAIGRAGIDLYALDFDTPLRDVKKFAKYVGGGAANISVGLSRLGLKVSLITKLGDDELGEFIVNFLQKEKVDTSQIKKTREARNGIVFAEAYPGRDSKFIFYRENAADLLIEPSDIKEDVISETKILITTGTGLSANPSRDSNIYAMELAKKHGKKNLLNLDWRPSLWKPEAAETRVQIYRMAIDLADMIVGNETEFMAATGTNSADEAISEILDGKERILLLTMGAKGSRIFNGRDKIDVSPFKVDSLKTLGAGDGIIAGFLYGYLNNWSSYKMVRFGNAVGAIVVTKHSCSEAMPTIDEALAFVERNGGWGKPL